MKKFYFDEDLHFVVSVFEGFLNYEEFTDLALGTLKVVEKFKADKILVDTSRLKVMIKENQQWIDTVWFPKAKNIGVSYMAFLVPEDIFGKMSMEATNKNAIAEGEIIIKYFEDLAAAQEWLQQM